MKVIYFVDKKQRKVVQEFIESLNERTQSRIVRLLTTIKRYGLEATINHTRKLVGTPLWEIRILGQYSVRLFYAVKYKDELVILHGFVKKSQKTPKKELKIGVERYYEYLSNS